MPYCGSIRWCSFYGKQFGGFPKMLTYGVELPYDSPKKLKTGTRTGTCMPVFVVALFTIAKMQEQFHLWMNG
jgi:hypothetical protein